jgi:hypothetical protein
MNKRPGHVNVTTEVALCSFCGRPRTLRREEHQLGTLVRTIVTCETCHRTLSSSIGVASAEPPAAAEVAEMPAPASAPEPEPATTETKSAPRKAAAKRPVAKATPARVAKAKPAAKPAAKAKAPAKRVTTKKR